MENHRRPDRGALKVLATGHLPPLTSEPRSKIPFDSQYKYMPTLYGWERRYAGQSRAGCPVLRQYQSERLQPLDSLPGRQNGRVRPGRARMVSLPEQLPQARSN